MDAKITKSRLAHMLSYDWLKIVAVATALILFWNLLFTMTATRVRPSQQFTVFNHYANAAFSDEFHDDLAAAVNGKETFSYEVIELTTSDLTISQEQVHTILDGRLQTDEGDVMFIPKLPDPSTAKEENGKTTYSANYLQTFTMGYRYFLEELDPENEKSGYFHRLKTYLNGYYTEGYENAESLDEAKIKSDFRARAKKNKDKRFKTEAQLQDGETKDVLRVQKYRDALLKFEGFLASGLVAFETVEVTDENGKPLYSGKFALNLCPDEDKMGNLKNYAHYVEIGKDEEGKETYRNTAKDMCVMFFDTKGTEDSFEFESLLYVVHIIEKSIVTE